MASSVCLSGCTYVATSLPCFSHWLFMKLKTDIHLIYACGIYPLSEKGHLGQDHKGHLKFLSCLFCGSMLIRPNFFLFGRNITREVVMCHTSFPGQKAKGQCQTGHLKSRSHWFSEVFIVSALRIHAYLTDSLYMWHKHNQWRDDVLSSISRSIAQRSRSHRSFEFFAVSAL